MGPKSEEFVKVPFPTPTISPLTSIEEWMERKRDVEGAEQLWRIHDKLYDFTLWARLHPGGRFWLDVTRGTDVTEAFESNHFPVKTESILKQYYRREAKTPRCSTVTFYEDGFHRVLKRRIQESDLTETNEPTWRVTLLSDCLAISVFATCLLGGNSLFWSAGCGALLGMLTICSQDFLHLRHQWRVNYFNFSLMSSREWRIRHVLSHHQYRNTYLDIETNLWRPLLKLISKDGKGKTPEWLHWVLTPFLSAISAHVQFINRVIEVLVSRKQSFCYDDLAAMFLPVFMILFSGLPMRDSFVKWNLIVMIASFLFSMQSATSIQDQTDLKRKVKSKRDDNDFGILQIEHHARDAKSLRSVLNPFKRNVLHYLCPSVDIERLVSFLPAFKKTCTDFGILYIDDSVGLLGEFHDNPTRGHVFFS